MSFLHLQELSPHFAEQTRGLHLLSGLYSMIIQKREWRQEQPGILACSRLRLLRQNAEPGMLNGPLISEWGFFYGIVGDAKNTLEL
jgi:hypothetical protein